MIENIKKYRVYAVSTKRNTERFIAYMYAYHPIRYERAEHRYRALLKPWEKIIVKEVEK